MKNVLVILILALTTACSTPTTIPAVTRCPEATAEPFFVDPIPATTDQTTITVHVTLGNMESVTITTESGTFTSTTGDVEVTLLPNTVHHLEVEGKVTQETRGNCTYGGYTLNTSYDKDGNPLEIEQTS
jgi:hypothetical protein